MEFFSVHTVQFISYLGRKISHASGFVDLALSDHVTIFADIL